VALEPCARGVCEVAVEVIRHATGRPAMVSLEPPAVKEAAHP
jgi:hypothetical protein